ncbi:hypothetical protein [Allisonella histaminiformans]|uniref:hypothetical protein n=1 Tax=Allisonella histaminiformans TaxID=209880 RepID=UPI002942585A|nr:hypothetical protein [Allisonella histaminiformans]
MIDSIMADCIYAILCMAVGYLWNKLKYYDNKQKNTDEGLKALLKDRLISIYTDAKKQKYITFDQMDRADMIYKAYHGLGGNGTGTAIIAELREMPKGYD